MAPLPTIVAILALLAFGYFIYRRWNAPARPPIGLPANPRDDTPPSETSV